MIEISTIGRIVVPPNVPRGFALFYTTKDFRGFFDPAIARGLTGFIEERFGVKCTLTTCAQVHGVSVARNQNGANWRECDSCDALVSADPHSALGIKVADCLP